MPVNRIISYSFQNPGLTITGTTTGASPGKTTSILSFNQHTIYTLLFGENSSIPLALCPWISSVLNSSRSQSTTLPWISSRMFMDSAIVLNRMLRSFVT